MPFKNKISRRKFLNKTAKTGLVMSALKANPDFVFGGLSKGKESRPNVVLVITDDQGFADLGCHGNPDIKTPNIDAFADESAEFTQFYVSAVCAPTRACLMTGRYNFRTGVVDTWMGRALMRPEEVTMAELFSGAGYATGIFGKWHLGDNYPLRPSEQGFGESLVHNGGGIGQPSDPPGNSYFDPALQHNGKTVTSHGYCTDIFTDAAIEFIRKNRDVPFFAYLSTNAPHVPLQISEDYVAPYRKKGLTESTSKVYGMITNIDDNMGRLLAELRELGIEKDTIVIFMTDNGPQLMRDQTDRYTAGLRSSKGRPYDGGIRVPFFIRWPERFNAGAKIQAIAAHIDVLPTLMDACGIKTADDIALDGISLMPLLLGDSGPAPERTVYAQWHRGDEPDMYRNFSARTQRYKLVHCRAVPGREIPPVGYGVKDVLDGVELFDMHNDPGERVNIAVKHPGLVRRMLGDYEAWFKSVSTQGFEPVRIHLGSPHENPVVLTRQDWRGTKANWGKNGLGYWEVTVETDGAYDITLRFPALEKDTVARFRFGGVTESRRLRADVKSCTFHSVRLSAGNGRIEAWLESGGELKGVHYVDVKSLNEK